MSENVNEQGGNTETAKPNEAGQENQTVTYTQSELDKAIQKAIDTREKNLKAENEKARLQEKGELEKLLAIERQEKQTLIENQTRKDFIIDNNLTQFSKFFANVPVDQLPAVKDELTSAINAQLQAEIKKQLKTTEPAGGEPVTPKSIKDMSNEDYKAWRENNINRR